jgi:hypothetical protein
MLTEEQASALLTLHHRAVYSARAYAAAPSKRRDNAWERAEAAFAERLTLLSASSSVKVD